MKKILLALGALTFMSALTYGTENKMGIGIGLGASNRLFKTEDETKFIPTPMLDVQYGKVYVKGIRVGYNVYSQDRLALSLFIDPIVGFKVKGKDMSSGYKNIDSRNYQVMGGAALSYDTGWEDVITNVSYEWGEHGSKGAFGAFKPISLTDRFFLIPGINFNYYSEGFSNYYFGVTHKEAARNYKLTGNSHKAGDAFSIGATLNGEYLWNDNMSLMLFTGLEKFSSEISDSPIVENDILFMMGAGFKYNF